MGVAAWVQGGRSFWEPPFPERMDKRWGGVWPGNRISNRGRKKNLLEGVLGSGDCTVHRNPFAEWRNASLEGGEGDKFEMQPSIL